MATLYVPRCGQGMVEDLTSGIGSSSPSALSALASAMASAGIGGGGVKASGNIALSGALAAYPTESTHGSITIPSGAAGIAIFSAAFQTTVGSNVAGFNAATMILYKNGQRVAANQNAMHFPSPGSASAIIGACAVVPVVPGDVLSVRATVVGFSGMSVDGANAHAYYVVI